MPATETRDVDKTGWGVGPWTDEPDRVEWRHKGVPCIMRRHPSLGHWCGYVAVSSEHPWAKAPDIYEVNADAHGGITYGPHECDKEMGVCHEPEEGETEDVRWVGFDCAHVGDYSPGSHGYRFGNETYKTVEYVKAQVEDLAEQALRATV